MTKYLLLLSIYPVFYIHAQCNNMVVNPNADEGLTGWNFTNFFGELSSEEWAISTETSNNKAFKCAYNWITKNQEIDLSSFYPISLLNSEPEIYVQEMYKGFATTNNEAHYNDLYYFYVELRDSSRNVLASFSDGSQENPLIANQNWQTSSYNFSYYGLGLRYIYIESGGRDNENWLGGEGGGYGTLIDSAVVKLDPNNTMNVDGVTLYSNTEDAIYQWLNCNNSFQVIPGATSQSFTPTSTGNYALEINVNGCIDTSACQTINSISITENNTKPFQVYPNPSSGELTIEMDNYYKNIEVTIKSISGQLISKQFYENTRNISFEVNQGQGLYTIETKIGSNHCYSFLIKIVK